MKYLFNNFLNTLRHYKVSSVLNIFGMAVAFAAFYVILTQVQWGFTYNKTIKDGERIYAMTIPSPSAEGKRELHCNRPLAEQILSSSPGVEAYGTLTFYSAVDEARYYLKDGDIVRRITATYQQGSKGALKVFGFEVEQGSFDEMSRSGAIALSSSFAAKNNLKVGDYLSDSPSGEPITAKVVAIWKEDFPENSGPGSIDMIYGLGNQSIEDWNEFSFPYFVKLRSRDDVDAFEESASNIVRSLYEGMVSNSDDLEAVVQQFRVTLVPFEDTYYSTDYYDKKSIGKSGNKTTDVSLLVVAILIILIALINFVNFFFALVPSRIRSVNTYKVFGTSRASLILSFILESVGMVVMALILAGAMVLFLGKTSFMDILAAPIGLAGNVGLLVLTIVTAIVGAAVSSIYPALYITSFQPAMVLKGSFGTSRAGRSLRNVLIGVQFVISLVLIICAAFVKLQHSYMMKFDMGFNQEYLISGVIPGNMAWWKNRNEAFEDKLRSNPDIVDLTWANGQLVNQTRMGWSDTYKGQDINYDVYPVAYNFLDVMGIEIVEGRNFTKTDELAENGVLIFNEEARDKYGISLDVRTTDHNGNEADMAGICRNFQFRPLQYGCDPFAFYVFGKDHSWRKHGLTHIYVRSAAGADPMKVMEFIRRSAIETDPEMDPESIALHLFDEELARKYSVESKLSKQVTGFTLIAIILALMGVFGLVFFETQHRMREIALRRVLGAEVKDILLMLSKKYAMIVLVCFALAAPVSYMVTNRYFSNFAYHMNIQPWVFVVALLAVLAVTIALVVLRSISAATKNPVESIKSE